MHLVARHTKAAWREQSVREKQLTALLSNVS